MANLAFVSYAIEGKKEDLRKLDKAFNEIKTYGQELRIDYGYPLDRFIGKLADEMNITDRKNWDLRGVLQEGGYLFDEENSVLHLECVMAWHNNDTFEMLMKKYAPSIRIYYYCDADDGFDCNDEEGKYFNGGYRIDYSLEEDSDIETFQTLDAFLARFNLLMDSNCNTFEEAEEVALNYEDDEYYINVYD